MLRSIARRVALWGQSSHSIAGKLTAIVSFAKGTGSNSAPPPERDMQRRAHGPAENLDELRRSTRTNRLCLRVKNFLQLTLGSLNKTVGSRQDSLADSEGLRHQRRRFVEASLCEANQA